MLKTNLKRLPAAVERAIAEARERRVQRRTQLGHAAAQAHLHGDAGEAFLLRARGVERRTVADRAAAIAGAGLGDHGFQPLDQAGGGRFGGRLLQEGGRTRGLLLRDGQPPGDVRRLLQLHARAQFALLQCRDARTGFLHRHRPPRVHQHQVGHGQHGQQQAERQPAVAVSRCRHRRAPGMRAPARGRRA